MANEKDENNGNEEQSQVRCCGTKSACFGIGALLASIAALCACGCGGGKKGDVKSDSKACC